MSWWSDVQDNYRYQKELKAHQEYCKAQQKELDAMGNVAGPNGDQVRLEQLAHQQNTADSFRKAPTPPANDSAFGRFFGGSATLSQTEQDQYKATQAAFDNGPTAVASRNDAITQATTDHMARRERAAAQAKVQSKASAIVPTATDAAIATHGMASKHHTMLYDQAQKYADQANGFLYVKTADDGLTGELRPTLPETLTIKGQEVKLREGYNRFVRAVARASVDKDGNPVENSQLSLGFFASDLSRKSADSDEVYEACVDEFVNTYLRPTMEPEPGIDVDQQVEQIADCLKLVRQSNGASALLNIEGGDAMDGAMEMLQGAQFVSEQDCLDNISQELQYQYGAGTEEYKARFGEHEVAVGSLYKDVNKARNDMKALRDFDVRGQEVPFINACSGNSAFMQGVTYAAAPGQSDKKGLEILTYGTASYIQAQPEACIDYLAGLSEAELLAKPAIKEMQESLSNDSRFQKGATTDDVLNELRANVAGTEKREAAIETISKAVDGARKYDYHEAGTVVDNGNQSVTIETFAAETTQLMVAPFTLDGAVGIYNQGKAGMEGYYNCDTPLPDAKGALLGGYKARIGGMMDRAGKSAATKSKEEVKAMVAKEMQDSHRLGAYGTDGLDDLYERIDAVGNDIGAHQDAVVQAKKSEAFQGGDLGDMESLAPLIMLTSVPEGQDLATVNAERLATLARCNAALEQYRQENPGKSLANVTNPDFKKVSGYLDPVMNGLRQINHFEVGTENIDWMMKQDLAPLGLAHMAAPALADIATGKLGAVGHFAGPEELQMLEQRAQILDGTQAIVRNQLATSDHAKGKLEKIAFPGEGVEQKPWDDTPQFYGNTCKDQLATQATAQKQRLGSGTSYQDMEQHLKKTAPPVAIKLDALKSQQQTQPQPRAQGAPSNQATVQPKTQGGPTKH